MTDLLCSRADVVTSTPERYAKQLMSHLGHRTTFTTVANVSSASFAGGVGRVIVGDGILSLEAEARDREGLARVQQVLGSHVARFGRRDELLVAWLTPHQQGARAADNAASDAGSDRPGGSTDRVEAAARIAGSADCAGPIVPETIRTWTSRRRWPHR